MLTLHFIIICCVVVAVVAVVRGLLRVHLAAVRAVRTNTPAVLIQVPVVHAPHQVRTERCKRQGDREF